MPIEIVDAIRAVGTPEAAAVLADVLQNMEVVDLEVAGLCVLALGEIGGPSEIPVLSATLLGSQFDAMIEATEQAITAIRARMED